jgi:hypothetical protein
VRSRDWLDKAIFNCTPVDDVRALFGEKGFPERARLVAELRSELGMSIADLEKRRPYVRAVLVMHQRLNSIVHG